jgi:DNA-binding MarR family transcriptional regulator
MLRRPSRNDHRIPVDAAGRGAESCITKHPQTGRLIGATTRCIIFIVKYHRRHAPPAARRSAWRPRRRICSNELELITATCPGYNLGKAYKRVTREFEQEFRDANLSLAQFALLVNIGVDEPATGTEIANRLGSDISTLSRTIDLLVKRGLVLQNRGEDRRVRVYCLTGAGRDALNEAIPKWRWAKRRTLASLGPAEWRRTLRLLRRMSA